MNQRIDQAANGHGQLNRTGGADDQSAGHSTAHTLEDHVDRVIGADPVQGSCHDAGQQEHCAHLRIRPAQIQHTVDGEAEGNRQNQQGGNLHAIHLHILRHVDFQGRGVHIRNQALAGIVLNLFGVAQQPHQAQSANADQNNHTQLPAGVHGQLGNGVRSTHSEGVKGGNGEGNQAGKAGNRHTHQRVIAQGQCQGDYNRHEGDDMLGPAKNAANKEEHDHHDGNDHLTIKALDLQNAVDAGCNHAGLVENLHNAADDHNGKHHSRGCSQTVGDRQHHVEQADRRTLHGMIAVSYYPGHTVDRLAIIGAGNNEIGHDGTDDHHDHQNQKRVQVAAEFLLFFLHTCSFFLLKMGY